MKLIVSKPDSDGYRVAQTLYIELGCLLPRNWWRIGWILAWLEETWAPCQKGTPYSFEYGGTSYIVEYAKVRLNGGTIWKWIRG